MTGENIVCFAKDWDDHPTSNTHVMRRARADQSCPLARIDRACARRARRAAATCAACSRRLAARGAAGRGSVDDDLWVASPLVLPLPHAAWAAALNRRLLRRAVDAVEPPARHGAPAGVDLPADRGRPRPRARRPAARLLLRRRLGALARPRRRARRRGRGAPPVPRAPTWCSRPRASLAAEKRRWNPYTPARAARCRPCALRARARSVDTPVAPEMARLRRAGARRRRPARRARRPGAARPRSRTAGRIGASRSSAPRTSTCARSRRAPERPPARPPSRTRASPTC